MAYAMLADNSIMIKKHWTWKFLLSFVKVICILEAYF